MAASDDAIRASDLLLGDDSEDGWAIAEPELLGVVAPFLHGELLARACDYGAYALRTRGFERPVGTELLNAVDAVARRLALEGGSSTNLGVVDELRYNVRQPLARPVWDAAVNLAHTAQQWATIETLWLTPWRGGLIEAARAAGGSQEQVSLYAAAIAVDPSTETLAEVAAFAESGVPPPERAVLLAWCAHHASAYRDGTLTAVAEALEGEPQPAQLETLAGVGLTAPQLVGALADETAARAGGADFRDTGLIAEWLEVALPEPPLERVRWQQRKRELAAQLETLDEPTRQGLIEEYLSRMIHRWSGAPPAAAPPPREEDRPFPSARARGRTWSESLLAAVERLRPTRGLRSGRSPPESDDAVSDTEPQPEAPSEPEPRYLNVAVVDTQERQVPRTETLLTHSAYQVQLDVGPYSETSIVVGSEIFDVSPLEPDTPEGYWLDAVVASADVEVERGVHRFFLPFIGPSWVCDCSGTEHTCAPGERQPHVHVLFHTGDTGVATLRCTVYHGNHVVQSARAELVVADGARRPQAQYAEVDYTLSAHFADVAALPERDLSVLTNETPGGAHTVVIKVDGHDIPVNISEAIAGATIRNIRLQLSLITVGRDGKSPQFGNDNEKPRDELIKDLKQLATLGARLWERVTPDGADYDYVRDKLRKRSTIQVARVQGAVFPWALVYDIGSEAFAPWKLCQLLSGWDQHCHVLETYPEECPFADEHMGNVLCPYGFWGYRHRLEQPPSRALITKIPLGDGARAAIVWNLALDPTHVDKIRGCLKRFAISDCDSRADLIAAIKNPRLPLVYFYCHGNTALLADTDEPLPYLEIGSDDRIAPGDFRTWADDGEWSVGNWTEVPPLVFINGCSTTAITPEGIVNFVDKLVQVGAAGVVGTEIAVAERTAAEIGIRFYGYFAGAESGSVGDALYRTRIDMLGKGNVSGLVYTPFCSMELVLVEQAA